LAIAESLGLDSSNHSLRTGDEFIEFRVAADIQQPKPLEELRQVRDS
jgi:hypothetical protein